MREKYTNIPELKKKIEGYVKELCKKAVEMNLDLRRITTSQISLLLDIPLMMSRYVKDYISLYNYRCEESSS